MDEHRKHSKLSVIIPVYNEKSTIERVLERVRALDIDKEIIIVDDGSDDGTKEIVNRMSKLHSDRRNTIRVHNSLINQGKGMAIRLGLEYVTGDYVIIQDADLELDPADYPKLLEPVIHEKAQVVYGSRFMGKDNKVGLISFLVNKFLVFLTNLLYSSRMTDIETAYKLVKTDIIKNIRLKCVGFEFEPEITAKLLRLGYTIHEIPVFFAPRGRIEGKKIGWKDGFKAVYYLLKYRLISRDRIRKS